ncbi:MazG nucleotide pyrophosphohydrolase domain-containing protein [Vagococcus silagei]|uniref:Nucleotide pyrophosphohydrolase n=1 Tax=Vagococcus silagei TaxID=2508885 RepID=A0A4S3B6E6_9ENTE|nr:MazG nucleotide pyrophosphohydrolase domain-containing protein [Vagococcus silagei]THB61106.1 nucleotide pyrophosphohydrolase [Vagococcus silagei]
MENLTITQLQKYLELKYQGKITSESLFMKLVEEVGEVAEMMNQLAGRKDVDTTNTLANELADVIHYTFAIAAINGIDLNQAIIEKDREGSRKYHQTPNLEEYIAQF